MMTDAWPERLSEYLDGTLTAPDMRDLELHLPTCATCRQSLAELRSVRSRLAADPVTAADQPTTREWAAIRRAIVPARRRWPIPAAIAASVIGLALAGQLFWPRDDAGQTTSLVAYSQASAELEALLRDNRERLSPETVRVLQASMAQIDSAIAQAGRALEADPANDFIVRYLAQLREARMMTLRQAVAVVHLRS